MIGLSKSGRQLYLDYDFQIDWQPEDDLLDFDNLGQASSWPIQVPIKGNEWAFGYASDPARSKNKFQTYDDFAITWGGNVWWECSFELLRVSDDQRFYEGTLSTINSVFFENRNKEIGEILSGLTIPITDGSYADVITPFNEDDTSMVFPEVHFYGKYNITGVQKHPGLVNVDNNPLIPAFKGIYLLRQLADALGYTFVNNFAANDDELQKITIMHNVLVHEGSITFPDSTYEWTHIGNEVVVGDYLPPVTLLQLLADIAYLCAGSIDVRDGRITITSIDRKIKVNTPIDISSSHSPKTPPSKSEIENIRLVFPLSGDKYLRDYTLEKLAGKNIGTFNSSSAFDAAAGEGDYGFCRLENAYYKKLETVGTQFYSFPFQSYESGPDNVKELTFNLLPAAKDRYVYGILDTNLTIEDNGAGKVRIRGFVHFSSRPSIGRYVRWEESKNDEREYPDQYYEVTASNSDYIDLEDLTYTEAVSIRSLIIRADSGRFRAIFGGEAYNPFNGNQGRNDFTGRILFYHGMQNNVGSTFTYPFASCDSIDSNGSSLGDLAIRFVEEGNIFTRYYTNLISFISSTRIVKMYTHLSSQQLQKLYGRFLRHQKGIILFRSFRALLTRKGIRDQEVEGYGV